MAASESNLTGNGRVRATIVVVHDSAAGERETEEGLLRDLRTIQPGIRAIYLGPGRVSLDQLEKTVEAELRRRPA